MPACGKAADRKLIRDHAPFPRVGSNQPDGAEHILLRFRKTVRRHTVMQDKGMEPEFIEFTCDRFALRGLADSAVSSAGLLRKEWK